ncbi:MAG: kelch repeat-containing protein [Saprospiraceae bacterium]
MFILFCILFVKSPAINIFGQQPIVTIPESRWIHQMTYDEKNNQILLFGGATNDKILGDLWSFNVSGWKKLSDSGPPPRCKTFIVYDKFRHVAVLFGGQTSDDKLLNDTWEWNGKSWKEIQITSPPARNHSMAVYDEKHKEIILFGGFGNSGLLLDTWSFKGESWKLRNNVGPKDCLPHSLIYDEDHQSVLMITVILQNNPKDSIHKINEMWEWTGDHWNKLNQQLPPTSYQSLQTLSSFGKSGIVLFDGDDIKNNMALTWSYINKKWISRRIDGPSPRIGSAMIFDKKRMKTILFGGSNRTTMFNDVWEWDGGKWKEVYIN